MRIRPLHPIGIEDSRKSIHPRNNHRSWFSIREAITKIHQFLAFTSENWSEFMRIDRYIHNCASSSSSPLAVVAATQCVFLLARFGSRRSETACTVKSAKASGHWAPAYGQLGHLKTKSQHHESSSGSLGKQRRYALRSSYPYRGGIFDT